MLAGALTFLAGALLASAYFLLKNRRNTPYLQLDLDALPALGEDLRTLAGLTDGAVTSGNACQILQDGALFPAMEADIAAARCAVHLETFVWTAGEVERRFVELLSRKAREGVKVRVLIDALGSSGGDEENLKRLVESGVQLSSYCKPRWWNLRRFNHRTHRKLLIIDGVVGYTFGHGIADQWLGHGEDEKHWRDTAVRVEGPAVQALQSVFMENWIEESHCVPAGEGCFPALEPKGDIDAHVVSSASGDAVSSVALLYTVAIACAKREVIIQNPYFAPDDGVCELLAMMVKRGVAVHLMLPGAHTDSPFVRRAGCRLYEQLLEGGVRLYEFMPTLIHQKIVIVDEIWAHIGSTNFDSRSLSLNEEVGIGIRDVRIARELKAAFESDLKRSKELTLEAWRRRAWYSRVFDWVAYQVHDQL
ncbi:phosphatidylserine/phosphatidylglycerophosphate/cardiolipin synthase family protein [Steroidobacter flavus]|uniref:Phosphatidylserine/phosphatidylglycerophosphate/ cardiolipin synthase family protein n=1 Tax=Steroidobacter flavus TaxID=1842136 RepID=A0ABV8SW47_9GAMM